jgi:hypothetical protein
MDDAERGHPRTIMAELERRDAPPEMIHAIASHADFLAVEPVSALDHTLLAVDELCGFLVACAQVRPEGIHGLTPKSVKNKLKQPSFAAAVSRDDVRAGAAHLDVDSTSTSRSSSPRSRSGPASSTCTAKPPRSDSGSRCTPRRRRRGLGRDPGPDAQSRLQPVRLLR